MSEWTALSNRGAEQLRVENQARHTANLKPGWYVTTGFFWHDECAVVAGAFTTQADAMLCRESLEAVEGHNQYFIDEVEKQEQQ